jgi:hypothetical protein
VVFQWDTRLVLGGDDRDRTGNLLVANQALSQLNYVRYAELLTSLRKDQAGSIDPRPKKCRDSVHKKLASMLDDRIDKLTLPVRVCARRGPPDAASFIGCGYAALGTGQD